MLQKKLFCPRIFQPCGYLLRLFKITFFLFDNIQADKGKWVSSSCETKIFQTLTFRCKYTCVGITTVAVSRGYREPKLIQLNICSNFHNQALSLELVNVINQPLIALQTQRWIGTQRVSDLKVVGKFSIEICTVIRHIVTATCSVATERDRRPDSLR